LLGLVTNYVRTKLPVRPADIPVLAETFRQIEDDGNREEVIFLRQGDQALARLRLDVGRIYDGQTPASEPLPYDGMEQVESITGDRLVVLIVRDERPAEV